MSYMTVLTFRSIRLFSFIEVMVVESNTAVRQAYLVRHHVEGTFQKSLESIWYPSGSRSGSTMIADLQALLAAGDDVFASQGDETAVVTIGDDIRIERFDGATLVVVLQPSNTFSSCQGIIASCSCVLTQCKFTSLFEQCSRSDHITC